MYIKASDLKPGVVFYYIVCYDSFVTNDEATIAKREPLTARRPPSIEIMSAKVAGLPVVDGTNLRFEITDVDAAEGAPTHQWEAPLDDGYLPYHWTSEEGAKGFFNINTAGINRGIQFGRDVEKDEQANVYYPNLKDGDAVWAIDFKELVVKEWFFVGAPQIVDEGTKAMALYCTIEGNVREKAYFYVNEFGRLEGVYHRADVALAHLATVKTALAVRGRPSPIGYRGLTATSDQRLMETPEEGTPS